MIAFALSAGASSLATADDIRLIPYPKVVTRSTGTLKLGPASYVVPKPTGVSDIAQESLSAYLPKSGKAITVRLGSVEDGYDSAWLTPEESNFLHDTSTSSEASVLKIEPSGITVVGKGNQGMLFGVQTINQLIRGPGHGCPGPSTSGPSDNDNEDSSPRTSMSGVMALPYDSSPRTSMSGATALPYLTIKDWPDMEWRCLSPTMTWYSGYLKLEGFDLNSWTLDEWKWLVDWTLLHKLNCWALCMYGNWPFTLPGYDETTLEVDSFYYDPKTGQKTPWRFTHKNIKKEFLPQLIRYANERGIKIYAYIGKNTFNGTYGLKHPDANAGGAAELIPFHPGVHEYWNAFIRRIIEIGFNGFVFEDPEAKHVPNQNEMCYKTFWEPWAKEYSFKSVEETDRNNPPLGVHVEYYSWLFKTFDKMIHDNAEDLHRVQPEIYLISHMLLSRMVSESKTQAERDKWFAYIDEKQGRKVKFIILEADEKKYVSFLGHDRVASLGGRGGSCTCAMRRIASINNNWEHGPFGVDLAYERACQKHIYEAGGFGAMAYTFEWTNTEVFGYLGAQYLWRNAGVPGIDNDNQTDFLYYAYPFYYGDEVGKMVARILDEGPSVNDAMMLEGVYGTQYPSTGRPLHRDYQLLAAIADRSVAAARKAYKAYTGKEPDLFKPVYKQEDFRWNGFDPAADKIFKSERLRLLFVSQNRSKKMCEAVLAHRMAERLIAEKAPANEVLKYLDKAVEAAKENQRLYCLNYDDDYDWTDGLCSRVVDELESIRRKFAEGAELKVEKPLFIPWEKLSDILPKEQTAKKPGIYLITDVGFDRRPDFFRLGVVFAVEVQQADGKWNPIFRRAVERRTTGWEHWEIPLEGLKGDVKLRFVTDSYSRAQDRNAPSWKWAIWGKPRVIEIAKDGTRLILRDLTERIDGARKLVRLDKDGKEREFNSKGIDSTGATFASIDPSPLESIKSTADLQVIDGFAEWTVEPPHRAEYRNYLGSVMSGWVYGHENSELVWRTAVAPEKKKTAVVFIGGTSYGGGKAEIWTNGEKLIVFDTAKTSDQKWEENGVELRYIHGGDTRSETIPYGISGIYALILPASKVIAGKPLDLKVIGPAAGEWFMAHEYKNVLDTTRLVMTPLPEQPAITAFTPHLNGEFGITIGEFDLRL